MFSLICASNKRLSKQSWSWWFETPTRSSWRHCNLGLRTLLVPWHAGMSLQMIWRSMTRRRNLRVSELHMSCRDFTAWQGTRLVAPALAIRLRYPNHYNDVIMGGDGVSNHRRLNCFVQLFVQAQIKENTKTPRHWPLWKEFTKVDSHHKGPIMRKIFPFDDAIIVIRYQFTHGQLVTCILHFPVARWRNQMETFSALPTICAGKSLVTGEIPTQRPVTRSIDVFFDLRLN